MLGAFIFSTLFPGPKVDLGCRTKTVHGAGCLEGYIQFSNMARVGNFNRPSLDL